MSQPNPNVIAPAPEENIAVTVDPRDELLLTLPWVRMFLEAKELILPEEYCPSLQDDLGIIQLWGNIREQAQTQKKYRELDNIIEKYFPRSAAGYLTGLRIYEDVSDSALFARMLMHEQKVMQESTYTDNATEDSVSGHTGSMEVPESLDASTRIPSDAPPGSELEDRKPDASTECEDKRCDDIGSARVSLTDAYFSLMEKMRTERRRRQNQDKEPTDTIDESGASVTLPNTSQVSKGPTE